MEKVINLSTYNRMQRFWFMIIANFNKNEITVDFVLVYAPLFQKITEERGYILEGRKN